MLLARLVVVVLEEGPARLGVPLDRHLVLAGEHQRLRVRQLLRRPRGVAVRVERPVVPVGADRQHQLLRRSAAQVLARAPGDGLRRGDRSRIVVGRVLVVRHQHQEVAGGGEPLDRDLLGIRRHVHRDQEAAGVHLAPQRFDEQRELLETLRSQVLEVDVDARVAAFLADPGQLARRVLAQGVRGQHRLRELRREPSRPVIGHGGHHLEALRRLQDARVLLDGEVAARLEADPLRHDVRELVGVLLQRAQARWIPVHHEARQHRRGARCGAPLALGGLRLLQQRPQPPLLAVVRGLPRASFERVPRRQRTRLRARGRLGQDLAPARPRCREDGDEERPGGGQSRHAGHDRSEPHRGASPSRFVPEDRHVPAVVKRLGRRGPETARARWMRVGASGHGACHARDGGVLDPRECTTT